jgi:long-subunit acyl-CoA synthetase (AMP-forming)
VARARTLCDLFDRTVARRGRQLALRSDDGSFVLTWSEYAGQANAAAAGLAGLGLEQGETVACWLQSRPEFNIADTGTVRLGAVPFSLDPRVADAQAERVLADAACRVLVTEPAFLSAALAVRDGRRTALETIVLVAGADAHALTWSELLDCARAGFDPDAAARAVRPDDVATLICAADGALIPITHREIVSLLARLRDRLELCPDVKVISWLPMAHMAERLCMHYLPMQLGWSVTTCADPRSLPELSRRIRPGLSTADIVALMADDERPLLAPGQMGSALIG